MGAEPSWPLLLRVLWSGLNLLPRFVLRRKYPPPTVARNFNVDLESTRAIDLSFGSSIPQLRLRLRYLNWNPFPVTVDRVDFEIWFGQPTITAQRWQRRAVAAYSAVPAIYYGQHQKAYEPGTHFEFQLDANQTKWIESQLEGGRLKHDPMLQITVFGHALGQEFVTDLQRILVPRHEIGGL